MKHIQTLNGATLKASAAKGGCGECQTSCQSACKTSCTVANQSCLVLRPARRDVDARLVYLYLRSALGQAALQSLDCGASTPLVQLSDLKKMPVPVPSPEEAQAIIDHAHEFVAQFKDKRREQLISLLVLGKYFHKTGQVF